MSSLKLSLVNAKAVVELFISAQGAEASSSLGIILGNFGLNMNQFCSEFNQYTQDLPSYFSLKVRIVVFENRTFAFSVSLASLGYYWRLLAYEKFIKKASRIGLTEVKISVLSLNDFFAILKLKFPRSSLENNFFIYQGVLKSCALFLSAK